MTTTTLHGYELEMAPNDGRPGFNCYVSHKRFHASLACLMDTGVLTNSREEEHHVPAWIINQIEEWALAHGY